MSREHPYHYSIVNPTARQIELWETACDDHVAQGLFPEKVCNGGGCGPRELSIWLFCNRTKAKVYAARLDELFGTTDSSLYNMREDDSWLNPEGSES